MAFMRVVDWYGVEHEVDAKTGLKVMENLRELDYGVAAICGGMCSCAPVMSTSIRNGARGCGHDVRRRELLGELSHYTENSRLLPDRVHPGARRPARQHRAG